MIYRTVILSLALGACCPNTPGLAVESTAAQAAAAWSQAAGLPEPVAVAVAAVLEVAPEEDRLWLGRTGRTVFAVAAVRLPKDAAVRNQVGPRLVTAATAQATQGLLVVAAGDARGINDFPALHRALRQAGIGLRGTVRGAKSSGGVVGDYALAVVFGPMADIRLSADAAWQGLPPLLPRQPVEAPRPLSTLRLPFLSRFNSERPAMLNTAKITLLFAAAWCGLALPSWGQSPSVDDLLAPASGGSTQIAQPAAVKIDKANKTVAAATAQDAANAAVRENTQELQGTTAAAAGARLIRFPSGLGVVATGVSPYRLTSNPTASRLSQRNAYVVAYTKAKKELAVFIDGMTNEGKDEIRDQLANIETTDESLTALSTSTETTVKQAADSLLRGFVVYEVHDDPATKTVTVSIVTTPKTRGEHARPASTQIDAASLREGMGQVLAEIKAGVVPPVGGRVVVVPATGETAFIGFGSSVIRGGDEPAIRGRMKEAARRAAEALAADALCGIIIGDRLTWQFGMTERYREQYQNFVPAAGDDPLAPDAGGLKRLDQAREAIVSSMEQTDQYRSARKGILPPGLTPRSWFDEAGEWAYAIVVYTPGSSNAAAGIRRAMDAARPLQPLDQGRNGAAEGVGGSARTKGTPEIRRGPTGKVSDDDGL